MLRRILVFESAVRRRMMMCVGCGGRVKKRSRLIIEEARGANATKRYDALDALPKGGGGKEGKQGTSNTKYGMVGIWCSPPPIKRK